MKNQPKTIAFIDAGSLRPNVVANHLRLERTQKLDWRLFVEWLHMLPGDLCDCHYYDCLPDTPTESLKNFHKFLKLELKFQLHTLPLCTKRKTCPTCKSVYFVDEQRGVDMNIVINMLRLAPHYEQAILISCDGDFSEVVKELRGQFARRVIVIAWQDRLATELRKAANETIFLDHNHTHFITSQ